MLIHQLGLLIWRSLATTNQPTLLVSIKYKNGSTIKAGNLNESLNVDHINILYIAGLMWWFLAREVLRLRGSISRELQWDVMPDLFFYRDPDEAEKEEQARQETLAQAAAQAQAATQPKQDDDWGDGQVTDWANEPAPGMGGAPVAPAAAAVPKYQVNEDWSSNQVQSTDWAAESAGQMQQGAAAQWGGSSNWN